MQALLFLPKLALAGAHAAAGAAGSAAGSVASWGAAHGSALSAIKAGTSALSAVSNFGLSASQGASLSDAAAGERMQASQELIQAQQTSNNLLREYDKVAGAQLATAAAGGVDISSGSVQAQQDQAQTDADRALSVIRTGAVMNASLRLARAAALAQAASTQRLTGAIGLATGLGKSFLSLAGSGAGSAGAAKSIASAVSG